MDQIKIGKFIAECRKKNNLTQMQLAEKLNITDRAISKWENGKSMPDSSIMLDLCKELKISVNDLLSGEIVDMNNYNEKVEQNLIEMVKEKKVADKRLLTTILFVLYCLVLIYVLFLHNSYRVGLNTLGIIPLSKEHINMCNAIPFKTIWEYFQRIVEHTINTNIVITNLLLNVIIFLPMGMAIPELCQEKINKFWKFLLFIILLTCIIEIIQFFTLMGSADIDDVILNTIGGCIGYRIIQIKCIRKLLKLDE